jgi:hypothetical protein
MTSWPSIFDQCKLGHEVQAGELPDAICAADLWNVVILEGRHHGDRSGRPTGHLKAGW